MRDRRGIFPAAIMALVLVLFCLSPGCTNTGTGENLTAGEIADRYLSHANAITDYQSEFTDSFGLAPGSTSTRMRFDYKSPHFSRIEVVASPYMTPGYFWVSNGTTTWVYNSDLRTYDDLAGVDQSREVDWQATVRRIVADRNFTVLDHSATTGKDLYLIEVATPPWSDKYTPFVSSRIQAWIEPSTGLAWNITAYYDCSVVETPTLPPGKVPPDACSPSTEPNHEILYEWIKPNTGIPDSYFDFVPPPGSSPRCVPKYVNYVEPMRTDTSIQIDQPLPGGVRYSLNETDSNRTVTLHTGEVVEITLRTITGLAYRWMLPVEGSNLELMNAGPICELPEEINGTVDFLQTKCWYRWRFVAVSPGTTTIDGIFALDGCDIQQWRHFNLTVQVT